MPVVRLAPCRPACAVRGDAGAADAVAAARLPAHSRGRRAIASGTGRRRRSSDTRDDRRLRRDPALHPRHDPRRVAGRPLTAAGQAGGRDGPCRLMRGLRDAACRPLGARRCDTRHGHAAAPDRLHPDPWARRAAPSESVASPRGRRRVCARRGQPASGDGLHRPRSRGRPRRIGADDPATCVRRRKRRAVQRGCRAIAAEQRGCSRPWSRGYGRRSVCGRSRRRVRRRGRRGGVIWSGTRGRECARVRRRAPRPTSGIGCADRRRDHEGSGRWTRRQPWTGRDGAGRRCRWVPVTDRDLARGERTAGRLDGVRRRRTGPVPLALECPPAHRRLTRRRLRPDPRGYTWNVPTERLMLLDGNGLIYRGYFALPPLTTSKGELVNAVFGFCSIVLRGIADIRPDYVAVAFDLQGPTFRHEQYADYKATRQRMPDDLRDQFPKVREVVKALRIPVYELTGYEADDVIGTITVDAERRDLETTIVTGDLDMLQLVTDRTRLMTTRSGVENTILYDPARIAERFELVPGQMIDYKALKGDPTDNIPGVPGVGEKTAAKLIREYGTLEALYERVDEVKPDKLRDKLIEHREAVFMGKDLSTIVRDLPVEFDLEAARLGDYDRETVIRLFREYEFRSLIERLPAMTGESAGDAAEVLRGVATDGSVPAARVAGTARPSGWGAPRPNRPVNDGGGLQLSLDFDAVSAQAVSGERPTPPGADDTDHRSTTDAAEPGELPTALAAAIDDPMRIEVHDGDGIGALEPWLAGQTAVGVALLLDDPRPRRGDPIAFALAGSDGRTVAVSGAEDSGALQRLLDRLRIPVVGHEVKPLLVRRIADDPAADATPVAFDTQIAAYILNAALRSQTIADIVAEQLDLILPDAATLDGPARAGLEALSALAVRDPLERRLVEGGLDRLFREIELPLIPVLARMEATGVAVDRDALALLATEFGAEISRLEAEIYADVGHEFNLGSPKQLEQVLFFELNLPKGKRTKTGYSTDASVLEDLRAAHPMIDKLLEWRIYTKLRSTYVDALPTLIASDGRLHTTFHQAVAATGRLSSSDPNLQNIPIRTPLGRRIRRAFVAGSPDLTLVAADYSQIELRILAHVSGDEHLRDAFARNADLHRETAALVLHKDPAEVTLGERSMAKMVNFGIAYGLSDFGLSERANIPRAEAQAFINTYFATYSGISYYMLAIKEQARDQGYVTTLLGRKRHIPELAARNPTLRSAGERMAINMPIQGTAADIVKIAMIRLDERLAAGRFRARPLLQVHDELLLEVPRDEVDRLVPILRETMEAALPLDVPLTVDIKVGDDWESMTPLTRADAIAAEADEAPDEAPLAPTLG